MSLSTKGLTPATTKSIQSHCTVAEVSVLKTIETDLNTEYSLEKA